MSFFQELRRRNVFRTGVAYLLVAWLVLQAVDFALDVVSAPDWALKVLVIAAAAGLRALPCTPPPFVNPGNGHAWNACVATSLAHR